MSTAIYFENIVNARNYFLKLANEETVEFRNWGVRKFTHKDAEPILNWVVIYPYEEILDEDEQELTDFLGSVSDILY